MQLYTAQASDSLQQKRISLNKTGNRINIDGRLTEPAWKTATLATGFKQVLPLHNQPVSLHTEVRLLQHEDFLYAGVFCYDTSAIFFSGVQRDFNENSQDCFGMVIDGFNDSRIAMAFITNPGGAQKDMMVFDDMYYDVEWDGIWSVRTSRTDSGWYAEFAIPWQTLRYKKEAKSWRINFFRRSSGKNEQSAWSLYPRFASPYRLQFAGELTISPPNPRLNIRVQPYLLSNIHSTRTGASKSESHQFKKGADLKWAISPKDVLDITVNTDFAQADADRRIVNLSRSSIFLPERRGFFLENAAFFSEGMKANGPIGTSMQVIPFLSRRVGLDENGQILPIRYGSRFVHRSAATNYGGLFLRQQEETGDKSFFVGRITRNIGNQGRVGFLHSTAVQKQHSQSTSSADAFFRIGNSQELKTMVSASYNNRFATGLAQYLQYDYKTEKIIANFRQAYVSRDYNPSVGFVSRNDVFYAGPGFYLTSRPRWIPDRVLFFEPGLFIDFFYQPSEKKVQEYKITAIPFWLTFKKGGWFGLLYNEQYQELAGDFNLPAYRVARGRYQYRTAGLLFSSNPFNTVAINSNLEYGGFFSGRLFSSNLALVIRPGSRFSYQGSLQQFFFANMGGGQRDKSLHLFNQQLRYAFSPRMTVSGFYQYDFFFKESGVNLRYAWEFRPLSFLYVIYNRNTRDSPAVPFRQQGLIVKASYIHQL